ncbi:probable ccr4-associated factor 1 homolog 11 [Phtheirospermum japonicum]|uniref:Probable ccr4-associated factor 1 homolog 11 n=1 Tax=Phtheirospermum japonicum TaxID=374723 RepID=A0A830DLV4_9LAMI|nr:probable ccr4-associated factor 1 homolog 11 [Phtheirospermum japonicum]
MDTEFPGTVFHPDGVPAHLRSTLPPTSFYSVMKKNIDSLNLIQIGLTLSDADGNLPTLGTRSQFVWEFNFRDFDYESDLQNPDSISLLERQGIDFLKNKRIGIDSRHFAMLFGASGLGPRSFYGRVMWVTFHGPYDFGFLIKILTRRKLPEDVYDVKNMIRLFGLHGGLDRVAESLNLDRLAGKSHQAGSDSLLTMHIFLTLRKRCLKDSKMDCAMKKLTHMVYGLTMVS